MRLRSNKLIRPRLQVKLTLVFIGAALIALVINAYMLNRTMMQLVSRLPHDELVVMSEWPALLRSNLVWTAVLLVPLMLGVGIPTTFRLTGPMHRMELYLRAVLRGEEVGECQLRRKDELQDFCELVNRATEAHRTRTADRPRTRRPAA
jgi:hypothetical protein